MMCILCVCTRHILHICMYGCCMDTRMKSILFWLSECIFIFEFPLCCVCVFAIRTDQICCVMKGFFVFVFFFNQCENVDNRPYAFEWRKWEGIGVQSIYIHACMSSILIFFLLIRTAFSSFPNTY